MREKEIVQTVTIKHQAVGTEATKAAVNSVTDAVKGLGAAAETTGAKQEQATRRQASAASAFEQLERRVNPAARALADYERAQRLVGRAVDQNAALQERGNAILQTYRDRVAAAGAAHGELGKGAGLARHELINLSRQAQDVAVSLGSGQGFGTVLLQQGTQIMDVLGTSQGGIRGALAGLGTSLRNLVTVGRTAFAGIAAGAAGAAFATSSYLSEQKNLERSLIGNRQASPAAINQIAGNRSSLTGFSISETREAALEFAKTGQIHSRVIGEMIDTTKNFALVTGQSSKEAAASLAKAFTDMSGIDALNKQFNFLDGATRNYIERLLLAGRTTEAAAVANQNLSVVLKQVEATQGGLEKGWTAIGNAISDATSKLGEYIARAAGLQRKTKLDSGVEIAGEIEGLQSRINRGDFNNAIGDTAQLDRATSRIEELRTILRQLNSELGSVDGSSLNSISIGAQQAINGINPFRDKIIEVEGALQRLKAAQQAGFLNPEIQQAVTQYDLILQNLKNQEIALENLRSKHAGMTDTFARQVESLEQQNRLLKARQNGTEATVSAAIAYENAIAAGANSTEAAAIKALTLKNNLLQASAAASNMSIQLDNLDWSEFDAYVARGGHSPGSGGFLGDGPMENNQSGTFRTDVDYSMNPKTWDLFFAGPKKAWEDSLSPEGQKSRADQWMREIEERRKTWQDEMKAIKDQTKALEDNTAALNKVTLNPLYTEGRSALKLGYMGAAKGMDFTVSGGVPGVDSVPIHIMAQQGERVQVTPAGQTTNDNSRMVVNNITNIFGGSQSTARRSLRQAGQGFAQMMAANS